VEALVRKDHLQLLELLLPQVAVVVLLLVLAREVAEALVVETHPMEHQTTPLLALA
jgi:hypothetical protein